MQLNAILHADRSGRNVDAKAHWQSIYETRVSDQLSWFQVEPRLSRQLIERFAPDRDTRILDVVGGASTLVDGLPGAAYRRITVLDLSPAALAIARRRLGPSAAAVDWREADVRSPPMSCCRARCRPGT
jgi:ubiquinone/menaquinone biosynthesis C-methylase UbiE